MIMIFIPLKQKNFEEEILLLINDDKSLQGI